MLPPFSVFNKKNRGFTLVETLVVVMIILFLAGLLFSVGSGVFAKGDKSKAISEMQIISVALEKYREAFGDYPRTNDPLKLLEALDGKLGPTMNELTPQFRPFLGSGVTIESGILIDPWGVAYIYEYTSGSSWQSNGYRLESTGVGDH